MPRAVRGRLGQTDHFRGVFHAAQPRVQIDARLGIVLAPPEKTSLVFSPRCVFAESLTARFAQHGFVCYSDHAGNSVDAVAGFRALPRLVVQMESIHKLADFTPGEDPPAFCALSTVPSYDVVVMDESESCLTQFSSDTMKVKKRCAEAFEQILRRAKEIILADAFISQKSLDTLVGILGPGFGGKRVVFRKNTRIPDECRRVAYDCAGASGTTARPRSALAAKDDITFVLMKMLAEGKHVVFVNSSATFARALMAEVRARSLTMASLSFKNCASWASFNGMNTMGSPPEDTMRWVRPTTS